jgi:hypothetical protein
MALSGTYTFNPSLGELGLYAYGMCGVRRTEITQEHMADLNMAANLVLAEWSSQGVNLWQVVLTTTPLVQGTATYTVDPATVMILDAYVTVGSGVTATDRVILPVSRSEYATYPNKLQQGFPSVYWFDRLLSPTITLYQVPDGNEVSLSYYSVKQIQDTSLGQAQQVDIPYYWLRAFARAIASELAILWAPDRAQALKAIADESYMKAADQNIEDVPTYITPMMSGYWRT